MFVEEEADLKEVVLRSGFGSVLEKEEEKGGDYYYSCSCSYYLYHSYYH